MIFEYLVKAPSIPELIERGFLVPIQPYAPTIPDLKGLKIRQGDYEKRGLESRMNEPKLVGDIVDNFLRICPTRQTVVFATGVNHSVHIRDRFRDAGIKAEHIDAKTPKEERDKILEDLASGEIQLVTNCMVLTEGWDCPIVSCCILARPTKTVGLYLQMAGRALRTYPGKKNCVILDHAGSTHMHGFVDQDFMWCLSPQDILQVKKGSRNLKESSPITCQECKFVYHERADCPACGWKPETQPESFDFEEGNLAKVGKDGKLIFHVPSKPYQRQTYQELKFIQREKNYNHRWIYHKYLAKFKSAPLNSWVNLPPLEPTLSTRNFVKYQNILYAKRQAKVREQAV